MISSEHHAGGNGRPRSPRELELERALEAKKRLAPRDKELEAGGPRLTLSPLFPDAWRSRRKVRGDASG
jgi:hypothetical protein